MKYKYHICDVFTDTRFGGNQLAVLPEAGRAVECHHAGHRPGVQFLRDDLRPARRARQYLPGPHLHTRPRDPLRRTSQRGHRLHPGGGNRARRTENQDPLRGKSGAGGHRDPSTRGRRAVVRAGRPAGSLPRWQGYRWRCGGCPPLQPEDFIIAYEPQEASVGLPFSWPRSGIVSSSDEPR